MSKQARRNSAIQWVAFLVPALASFPAAYFVGRSTYYHLILKWSESHVAFWPALGVTVAIVTGLVVEGLGTVSVFLWSAFRRWNRVKAVRDDGTLKRGYDKAPTGMAFTALVGYAIAVVVLLVVLEWMPGAAQFAPVLFAVLTVTGGLCWSLYDEHRDRLAYHGISWNWVAQKPDDVEQQPAKHETRTEQLELMVELDETSRAIVRAMEERPGASYQTIADAVGMPKSTVYGRAKLLEREGVIVRGDNGR